MYDKEDFFSPEMVDERLELSLLQQDADAHYRDSVEADPNLLLISDLRYLYGAEGTENVRSLQRVWENLKERPAQKESTPRPVLSEPGSKSHLRLLKPGEEAGHAVKRRRRYDRGLAVLAAVLFLVVMVGSLFTIVHLVRSSPTVGSGLATTPGSTTIIQPTAIPGYPYPQPGHTLAVSPPSADAFYALSWSPDGKQLAISTQGKIWIWDVASNQYRMLLNAQLAGGSVKALAWSPNGHFLAVGSNPIQMVDPASGKIVGTYSADYPLLPVPGQTTLVTALGWSPDGTMLAVATQHADAKNYIFIWNMLLGTGIYTFDQQGSPSGISSISWSGDNRYVASTDARTVQAWDIRNGYVIFKHSLGAATNVVWSPGALQPGLLAFVNKGVTQVWNVWQGSNGEGKLISSYPAANGVLSWSPKGQYLATANGNTVLIFDTSSGARIYTYDGDTHFVSSLAWSPDGNALATGESNISGSNFARVWSA